MAGKGTNQLHSWLQPLWGNSPNQKFAATDTEVIAGLLPPNVFPQAVLIDHPDRLRGVWIDSSNPANTAANTAEVEKALASLDLCVVVDVAMTETARLAHYVLPASSQYEKTEFTLFNFEFPRNFFQVRAASVPPLEGTLPEPEIYTRLARALGLLPGDNALAPLREAAFHSRPAFAQALRGFMGANPQAAGVGALVLYHTLGATLPDGTAAAAPLWQAAQACAKRSPEAVRRALGEKGKVSDAELGDALFDAVVGSRSGVAITEHAYDDVWSLISHPDRKVHLAIAPLLEWLGRLDAAAAQAPKDYPFVLAAGQRRMFNANQIFRDPAWRRDDPDGALLINTKDLEALGASDGEWIAVQSPAGRVVVACQGRRQSAPGPARAAAWLWPVLSRKRRRTALQRPAHQRADRQRQLRSDRGDALSQACRGAAGAAGRHRGRRFRGALAPHPRGYKWQFVGWARRACAVPTIFLRWPRCGGHAEPVIGPRIRADPLALPTLQSSQPQLRVRLRLGAELLREDAQILDAAGADQPGELFGIDTDGGIGAELRRFGRRQDNGKSNRKRRFSIFMFLSLGCEPVRSSRRPPLWFRRAL